MPLEALLGRLGPGKFLWRNSLLTAFGTALSDRLGLTPPLCFPWLSPTPLHSAITAFSHRRVVFQLEGGKTSLITAASNTSRGQKEVEQMTTLNPTEVQEKGEELLPSGSGKTSWKFYLCWISVDKLEQAKQGKGGLREGNDVRQVGSRKSPGQVQF